MGKEFSVSFARTKQAEIWQAQRQEAIECGEVATEVVRHDDRGGLLVGAEIIGQIARISKGVDDPTEGRGKRLQWGDLRPGTEKHHADRQRNRVDESVVGLGHQGVRCDDGGAIICASEFRANAAGAALGEIRSDSVRTFPAVSPRGNPLDKDLQFSVATEEPSGIEVQQGRSPV